MFRFSFCLLQLFIYLDLSAALTPCHSGHPWPRVNLIVAKCTLRSHTTATTLQTTSRTEVLAKPISAASLEKIDRDGGGGTRCRKSAGPDGNPLAVIIVTIMRCFPARLPPRHPSRSASRTALGNSGHAASPRWRLLHCAVYVAVRPSLRPPRSRGGKSWFSPDVTGINEAIREKRERGRGFPVLREKVGEGGNASGALHSPTGRVFPVEYCRRGKTSPSLLRGRERWIQCGFGLSSRVRDSRIRFWLWLYINFLGVFRRTGVRPFPRSRLSALL